MDHKISTTVEDVRRSSTKKDGSPYIDKNKKPFTVVSIKLSETLINDQDWNGWCSVMDYSNDFNYQQGDHISGYITKRVIDDRIFWNFRKPSKLDDLEERVTALEDQFAQRFGQTTRPQSQPEPVEVEPVREDEEDLDLPF